MSVAQLDFAWPVGMRRVPDEKWARAPLDRFGVGYDRVGGHRYYAKNLDPLVAQVAAAARDGQVVVDYSGGTGLLTDRVLAATKARIGVVNVDPSAKFLRVAVANQAADDRTAFRLLDYDKQRRRLCTLAEVLGPELAARGADILLCANAMHLYPDPLETFRSWHQVVRADGLVLLSSGCVRNPATRASDWLLDDTVDRVNEVVADLVLGEPAFARYRDIPLDHARWAAHVAARQRVFVPVRPLRTFLDALDTAGFEVCHVGDTTIFVDVGEFAELLTTYHENVLGWVGGTRKVDGQDPDPQALRDRAFLIRYGLDRVFAGAREFPCNWTYLTCRRAEPPR